MWEGAKKETRVEMVWRVDKVGTSNKRKWLRINAVDRAADTNAEMKQIGRYDTEH